MAEETLATAPPPPLPPDPPPSLVAARRLMFDTDDAKLMKHDHAVNTARLVHSIKKDLSSSVDLCQHIESERTSPVNITIDKESSLNTEMDDSVKDSNNLAHFVNKSTISEHPSLSNDVRDSAAEDISSCLIIKEDDNVKVVKDSHEKRPLVISEDTPSFNDNGKTLSLHSERDNTDKLNKDENNEVEEQRCFNSSSPATATNEVVKVFSTEMDTLSKPLNRTNSSSDKKDEVSMDLNAKSGSSYYPDDLNPFGDSADEEDNSESKVSTNPFGSDSEEEVEAGLPMMPPPRAAPRNIASGAKSTNPFGSDSEDEELPLPSPRKSLQSSPEPTPFPRRSRLRISGRSVTSLSSIGSYSSTSPRKKRPAPPPPPSVQMSPLPSHLTPSRRQPSITSLSSIRSRKTKRAPLPPSPSASRVDQSETEAAHSMAEESPLPPQLVVTASSNEPTQQTAGELISEINEGMQELIAQHDTQQNPSVALSSKEEKDTINELKAANNENPESNSDDMSFMLSLNENTELNAEHITAEQDREEKSPELNLRETCHELSLENKTPVLNLEGKTSELSLYENIEQPSEEIKFIDEENQISISGLEETTFPVSDVIINKDKSSLIEDASFVKGDDDFQEVKLSSKFEEIRLDKDDKTENIVEAFNEELRRCSGIRFEELSPTVHSTPLKVVPCPPLADSSLEDVTSDPLCPSSSCASSYQESLASPLLEKKYKDSANMHKKITGSGVYTAHKSVSGQWKRKKGPAPALPIPQRRSVKPMAIHKIHQELGDIEIKQQELERQGVALEQKIRLKFDEDTSITPYLEELVLQLFELVNEKNELFRKQAELMYMRRQHQLEEEHAELEYQIRCLMSRPEANKTDSDKELEEKLIQRLVEVVERRDAIIQCLEMDRLREVEEDRSIHKQLDNFTRAIVTDERMKIRKKHKKKKDKQNTLKISELDKDIDESERGWKKKKKWYTLSHKSTKHL